MPTARPAILTDTLEFEGVVPEVGFTLSQGALLLILYLSWLSVVLMLSVWLAGLAPNCVAVKVRLDGLTTMQVLQEPTVKFVRLVAVPNEFVTLIGPVVAPVGTVAVI